MRAEVAGDAERQACARAIDLWTRARLADDQSALVTVDRQLGPGIDRWYLRLRGEEKDFVTVWMTMRQRTLHQRLR